MLNRRCTWLIVIAVALAMVTSMASCSCREQALESVKDAPTSAELQAALDDLVAAGVPGAVLYIKRPDGLEFLAASGEDDQAAHAPLDPAVRFNIASVTKPYVATLMLKLTEAGVLSLDDTVERWLPGVLPYGHTVTVLDLLRHTSGIPDYLEVDSIDSEEYGTVLQSCIAEGRCVWDDESIVALVADMPPDFPAGEEGEWSYCNTGYVLAGMILEKASGKTLGKLVEELIAAPLGLEHTGFPDDWTVLPEDLAHGYEDIDGDGELDDMRAKNPSGARADGAMLASTEDTALFFDALLEGRILQGESLEKMLSTVQTGEGDETYGLGVAFPNGDDSEWIGHDGVTLGYEAVVEHNRGNHATIVMLQNASNTGERAGDAQDSLLLLARRWANACPR